MPKGNGDVIRFASLGSLSTVVSEELNAERQWRRKYLKNHRASAQASVKS